VVTGLFVTFEGGEGSGKSTQIDRVATRLIGIGRDPVVTREPGGTPLAEDIRTVLLGPEMAPGALTEALLMEAARSDLVSRAIRPALEAGPCRALRSVRRLHPRLPGGRAGTRSGAADDAESRGHRRAAPGPHLALRSRSRGGLARREQSHDPTNRLDREPLEFHQRVRARYLELAVAEPGRFVVLDATLDPDRLERMVWTAVESRCSKSPRAADPICRRCGETQHIAELTAIGRARQNSFALLL
jgi:dTMP kinase